MKKLFVLLGIIVINVTLPCCKGDNKKDAPAVPEAVITAFNAKYQGVNDVKWKEEDNSGKTMYDGEFKMNDKKMEARFDDAGNFVDEK